MASVAQLLALLLLAPAQRETLPLGEPIAVEAEDFAVEARLTPFAAEYYNLNGKTTPIAKGHLLVDVHPLLGQSKNTVYGVANWLETPGEFSSNMHLAGTLELMGAPPNWVAPDQPARPPGRRFWIPVSLPHEAGVLPKSAKLKTELLVGNIAEDKYAFAGEALAPGASETVGGIDARLFCFDIDPPKVVAGIRLRGTPGKLMAAAPMKAELLGADRKAMQWKLETTDGEELVGTQLGACEGTAHDLSERRFLAAFALPPGKQPKALTLTIARLDGEWRRLPLKFDAAPQKAAAKQP